MGQHRRFVSALLASMLVAAPAASEHHLVTPGDIHARLAAAAVEREEHLRSLEAVLSGPAAEQAAALVRVDLARIRAGVPSLTDEELRDLDARAEALRVDPVAGTNAVILVLAVIGAAVILLFVLAAIACWGGNCD